MNISLARFILPCCIFLCSEAIFAQSQHTFSRPITISATVIDESIAINDINNYTYNWYVGMVLRDGDVLQSGQNRIELQYPVNSGFIIIDTESSIEVGENIYTANAGYYYYSLMIQQGALRALLVNPHAQNTILQTNVTYITTAVGADVYIERTPSESHTVRVYTGYAHVYNLLTKETFLVPAGCEYNFFAIDTPVKQFQIIRSIRENESVAQNVNNACNTLNENVALEFLDTNQNRIDFSSPFSRTVRELLKSELHAQFGSAENVSASARDSSADVRDDSTDARDISADSGISENDSTTDTKRTIQITDQYFYVGFDGSIGFNDLALYGVTGIRFGYVTNNFSIGLLLPISFQFNPFDPNTWFTYRGTHEWNFGVGSGDVAQDIAQDIVSKFEYIRIGEPDSTLFILFGAIDDITFSTGALIKNYSNALDSPFVRQVGAYLNVDTDIGGVELFTNDVTRARFFGARGFLSIGDLDIGLSAISDWGLINFIDDTSVATLAVQQIALGILGFDIGLNISGGDEDSRISMVLSAAATLPLTIEPTATYLFALFRTDGLPWINNFLLSFDVSNSIKNITFNIGAHSWGGFIRPYLFNNNYDRHRANLANDVSNYLLTREIDRNIYVGPYVGMRITNPAETIVFEFDAFVPVAIAPIFNLGGDDVFQVRFKILEQKGEGFYTDLFLLREGLIHTLTQTGDYQGSTLLDSNTLYGLRIGYLFINLIDVSAFITTTAVRDNAGNIVLGSGNRTETNLTFGLNVIVEPKFYF